MCIDNVGIYFCVCFPSKAWVKGQKFLFIPWEAAEGRRGRKYLFLRPEMGWDSEAKLRCLVEHNIFFLSLSFSLPLLATIFCYNWDTLKILQVNLGRCIANSLYQRVFVFFFCSVTCMTPISLAISFICRSVKSEEAAAGQVKSWPPSYSAFFFPSLSLAFRVIGLHE